MSETTDQTPPEEPIDARDDPADPAWVAAQFDLHHRVIDGALASINQLNADSAELSEWVVAVAADLGRINNHLSGLPGGPWSWKHLDSDQRAALWFELFDWVEWLQNRYVIHLKQDQYGLRPCWYKHPLAVEYLTALMVSHQAAYSTRAVLPSAALVEWHERSFWPMMTHLKSVWGKCTAVTHSDPELVPILFNRTEFELMVLSSTIPETASADADNRPGYSCAHPHASPRPWERQQPPAEVTS